MFAPAVVGEIAGNAADGRPHWLQSVPAIEWKHFARAPFVFGDIIGQPANGLQHNFVGCIGKIAKQAHCVAHFGHAVVGKPIDPVAKNLLI